MIVVKINQPQFEYDIHSLVKVFYPAEEVKVFVEGAKELSSTPDMPSLRVSVEKEEISCILEPAARVEGKESFGCETMDSNRVKAADSLCRKAVILPQEERTEIKNKLKQLLYQILSAYTQKELPWGNLTGIRPTKIAYQMLEEGSQKEEILAHMEKIYQTSRRKAQLSVDIAALERKILSNLHAQEGYSLYVGIPFCPTTCLYCSFTAYPIGQWKKKVEDYLDALEKEMDYAAKQFAHKPLDTVYVGGGTPTTLEPCELERLFQALQGKFDFSRVQEFTVEAGRADSITEEKLRVMKKYGVSRISVNPQTMKEETLRLIGRQHTVEQTREAFALARSVGFTNINMDMILGLPGESREDVEKTMEAIAQLSPDSLTVHSLAVKRASRLNQWIEENGIDTLKNTEETMEIAASAAAMLGMRPYYLYRQKNMAGNLENVGYAKEGCYGLYNILMMEEKQTIVACGAGTVTKRVFPDGRIERCDNVKDVAIYIEKIDEMIERKRKLFEE